MSFYRQVDVRVWGDQRFQQLSSIQPSGQGLWLFLLTAPNGNVLPGLIRSGAAALADELGWSRDDVIRHSDEIEASGMARFDFPNRTIFLPNALRYHSPRNPKTIAGWVRSWDSFPEGPLRSEWMRSLIDHLDETGRAEWVASAGIDRQWGEWNSVDTGIGTSIDTQVELYPPNTKTNTKTKGEGRVTAPAPFSWDDFVLQFERDAEAEGAPSGMATVYLDETRRQLDLYFEKRNGSFTETRQKELTRRLEKYGIVPSLYAIEKFLDAYAGARDHKYLAGIAMNLSKATPTEQDREIDRHRERTKDGVFRRLILNQGGTS